MLKPVFLVWLSLVCATATFAATPAGNDGSYPAASSRLMLLGALATFDLICTLAAWHTGMFREVNPLASQMAQGPLTIIALKVVATGTAVAVLFRLRRYAGAQLASWWMCFVCTLVTFRWVTFHSMFLE